MNKFLILAAAMVLSGTAHASYRNGNLLYKECMSEQDAMVGICVGYIGGVVDTDERTLRCLIEGIDARQVRDVVRQYLQSHPEKRHLSASGLVIAAVQEAFCQ